MNRTRASAAVVIVDPQKKFNFITHSNLRLHFVFLLLIINNLL